MQNTQNPVTRYGQPVLKAQIKASQSPYIVNHINLKISTTQGKTI